MFVCNSNNNKLHVKGQYSPFMATNPSSRSRGLQQQSSSSGGPNGRHNLFSSTLSRRPSGNPSTSASTTTVHSSNTENQEAADIVVRDEHGNYRLDLPRMTPIPRDEASEEQGQSWNHFKGVVAANLTLFSEAENRLIETYMKHQQHIEPNGK